MLVPGQRAILLCCLFALACPGNHGDLAQDTSSSASGGGGGGSAGAPGTGGENVGGTAVIVEPDGPPSLTVVNAIVDRPEMQLCFLESPASAGDAAEPWPAAPLEYARADASGPPLPARSDVEIVVLTGDLEAIGASSCREIADDPASFLGLELLSIGVAPAATFTAPRSFVLAVTGCFGGPGHDGEGLESICGPGYSAETPTPGVVVAPMSRLTTADAVGFQVVNGLAIGAAADVYVRPGFDGVLETMVATAVVPGAAAPFPPSAVLSAAELGSPALGGVRATVEASMTIEIVLGDAMENGGTRNGDFANGHNVALVLTGPAPGAATGSWWNDFSVVALNADPTRP